MSTEASAEQIDDYEYLEDEDTFLDKSTTTLVEQALAEQAVLLEPDDYEAVAEQAVLLKRLSDHFNDHEDVLLEPDDYDHDYDHEAFQKSDEAANNLMDDRVDEKFDMDDDEDEVVSIIKTKITSQKSDDEDKSHSDDYQAATKAYKEKYANLFKEEEKELMQEELIEQSLYESESEEKNKELEILEGLEFRDDDFESEEESLEGILEKHEFDHIDGDEDPDETYFNAWTDTLNYARDNNDDYLNKLTIEEEKIQNEEAEDQREDIIYTYDDILKFAANIKMDDEVEQDDNLPAGDDDDAWVGNGEDWVGKGDTRHTWAAAAIFFSILYLAYYIKRKWGYHDQDRYRGYHQSEMEMPRMEQEFEENAYDNEVDDERCGLLGN